MNEKIKEKPYHLFLILILINLIFTFLSSFIIKGRTIDIQLHDAYFVIDYSHVFSIISVFVSLLWILYRVLAKYLWSKKLTWIHVLSTFFCLLLLFNVIGFFIDPMLLSPKRSYYSYNESQNYFRMNGVIIITFAVIILFFSQFLFLINIIVGIIKKTQKS